MTLDPDQRARVLGAKLRALVAARWPAPEGGPEREPAGYAGGAAMVAGDRAWVLAEDPSRGLGAALAWCRSRGVAEVDVLVGEGGPGPGDLARRASLFAAPPRVWRVAGTVVEPAEPAPPPVPAPPPADVLALGDVLARAGLDVVVDHGVVSGEILGLEVARVVADAQAGPRIEVGVGRADREAFAEVHGDLPVDDALRSVVDTVRSRRRAGAPSHPLNRIAGERWLRSHLLGDPDRLPGWHLEPVEGPVPRGAVSDVVPAIAVGTDAEGRPVVLACSVGIDLEVVPLAADARAGHDPDARLVVALPARDAHDVTRALAEALAAPAEVLPIEGEWRR